MYSDLLYMIFFHDACDVGVPTNIRKLQLPSKLRIKPSMCEREEWPNHLQGNGVGDSPRDTNPWSWLTLPPKKIDQPSVGVLRNDCSLQWGDIFSRKSKKILRPRGFSYISHIQKNVFKKKVHVVHQDVSFHFPTDSPHARGLIEVDSSIFHFQRLGANRVAGEEQPSTVEEGFKEARQDGNNDFWGSKKTPRSRLEILVILHVSEAHMASVHLSTNK